MNDHERLVEALRMRSMEYSARSVMIISHAEAEFLFSQGDGSPGFHEAKAAALTGKEFRLFGQRTQVEDTPKPTLNTTYKRADGEMIYGEIGWTTDDSFFEDVDDPLEVIVEHWQRTKVETKWYFPSVVYCEWSLADGEHCEDDMAGYTMNEVMHQPIPLCALHLQAARNGGADVVVTEVTGHDI